MNIEERFEKNVVLAPFTSFKIGGPAEYFFAANTPEDLVEAVIWARAYKKDYVILGGGSNVLVHDAGFAGLVIKNDCRFIDWPEGQAEAVVQSGAAMALLVDMAKRRELIGLEWAVGLPGTVGGAVWGNAGAFGQTIAEAVKWLEIYDLEAGQERRLAPGEAEFAYRSSVFRDKPWVLLRVCLAFKTGQPAEIEAKMKANLAYRLEKQPAWPSAGSVFRNPSLEAVAEANAELAKQAEEEGIAKNGLVSAGWIVGQLHLKGKEMGGAMVSLEHANFIVNKSGQAKAEDVVMLLSFIKQQSRLYYNLNLLEEIIYIGF
jgi:UDP-N-acetylmuramate dehydrogenase